MDLGWEVPNILCEKWISGQSKTNVDKRYICNHRRDIGVYCMPHSPFRRMCVLPILLNDGVVQTSGRYIRNKTTIKNYLWP